MIHARTSSASSTISMITRCAGPRQGGAHGEKTQEAEILARQPGGREKRDAPLQARHGQERQRRQGWQGEEPQAGYCHRAVKGPEERQESPEEKEVVETDNLLGKISNEDHQ